MVAAELLRIFIKPFIFRENENLGKSGQSELKRKCTKECSEKFVKTNEDVCLLLFDGMTENLDKKGNMKERRDSTKWTECFRGDILSQP